MNRISLAFSIFMNTIFAYFGVNVNIAGELRDSYTILYPILYPLDVKAICYVLPSVIM